MAREIAGKSPDAIRAAKRLLNNLSVDPGPALLAESVEQQKLIGKCEPDRGGPCQSGKARAEVCGLVLCRSGMVRRTRPQVRNCAPGNLEIPGSMLRIAPE
ncbi:hypothetical protein BRDID11002_04550 [Bradyrhizobium diazoefficiens]